MNRLKNALTNRRVQLVLLVGAVISISFLLLFATTSSVATTRTESTSVEGLATTSSSSAALGFVIAIVVLIAVLIIVWPLSGAESDSKGLARQITSTPIAEALLERWLRRSRHYRFIGGLVAFLLAFVNLGQEAITSRLFLLLGGIALGGALAEIHVLRRHRNQATTAADLTARNLRDFTDPVDLIAMGAIATGAVIVLLASVVGWRSERSLWWSIGAMLVIVAVLGFQSLVASRPRPALRPELRDADDLLRFLAATQGFARPAIAAAFFMVANSLEFDDSHPALEIASAALVIAGLVWWYRGRHGRIPGLAQARMTP